MRRMLMLYLLGVQAAWSFSMQSQSFAPFGIFSTKYVCNGQGGQNVSPQLSWSDLPTGTRSLVLLLHDPDAPGSRGFVHWAVYLDDPTISSLPEGAGSSSGPDIIVALNGMDNNNYFGPCPPSGTGVHRYNFTLYALDTVLDKSAIPRLHQYELINQIWDKIVGQAVLTGFYIYKD